MSKECTNPFKVPHVAWPTLILVASVVVLWCAALMGSLTGALAPSVAAVFSVVAAHAAFTGLHDASHFALGKQSWLSILAGEVCAAILLANFQMFRQVHLRHHRHTNDPVQDPDAWLGMGPRWLFPIRWAFVDLHYLHEFDRKSLRITNWERCASWLGALVAVAVGLIATGHWWRLFFLWVLPARLSLLCATYYADFVPHRRPRAIPKKRHPVHHTANLRGRWLGLLLLGHNLHLIHHLYPAVPFYYCGRIWRARRSELLARGALEVTLFSLGRGTEAAERGRNRSPSRASADLNNEAPAE